MTRRTVSWLWVVEISPFALQNLDHFESKLPYFSELNLLFQPNNSRWLYLTTQQFDHNLLCISQRNHNTTIRNDHDLEVSYNKTKICDNHNHDLLQISQQYSPCLKSWNDQSVTVWLVSHDSCNLCDGSVMLDQSLSSFRKLHANSNRYYLSQSGLKETGQV